MKTRWKDTFSRSRAGHPRSRLRLLRGVVLAAAGLVALASWCPIPRPSDPSPVAVTMPRTGGAREVEPFSPLLRPEPGEITLARIDDLLKAEQDLLGPGDGVDILTPMVGPHYFETMGIPLLKGRDFSETDGRSSPRVAIVNETAARRLFPGEDPIGKRLTLRSLPPFVIVGVVKDATPGSSTPTGMEIYFSSLQGCSIDLSQVV
jgi:hypothetical protein